MKKSIAFFFVFCLLSVAFAEPTAYEAAQTAAGKDNLKDSLSYLTDVIKTITVPAEKRALYAFTGSLYEQSGRYDDAKSCYADAAGIAAVDADNMPKNSSEQLVLDAVRCALSEGDYTTADDYLNSAVSNSEDPVIQAYIKLYAQWSLLCRAETTDDTNAAVIILDAYSVLPSMLAVRPVILLTLWYVTGKNNYADSLKKQFPASPEASIVDGTVQQLPAPFWYFVPHKVGAVPGTAVADNSDVDASVTDSSSSAASATESDGKADDSVFPDTNDVISSNTDDDGSKNKAKKEQLGLFRDKTNAETLVDQLKKKGFSAYITSEVRPSGTTYYIVVVDENDAGTMGENLRTAGFECYPVFD